MLRIRKFRLRRPLELERAPPALHALRATVLLQRRVLARSAEELEARPALALA